MSIKNAFNLNQGHPLAPGTQSEKTIMFVDDDAHYLNSLRRCLPLRRVGWNRSYASNGAEALEKLGGSPVSVIVSDLKMPGIDGLELLQSVRSSDPAVIRIVLSGYTKHYNQFELRSLVHQVYSKPFQPEGFREIINRVDWLEELGIPEDLKKYMGRLRPFKERTGEKTPAGRLSLLPTMINELKFDVMEQFASSQVESRSFDNLNTTTSFHDRAFQKLLGKISHDYLRHAGLVAHLAEIISWEVNGDEAQRRASYLAGLFHDIGKVILTLLLPQSYAYKALPKENDLLITVEKEKNVFGTTHAQIGAYLTGIWGWSLEMAEAIALHHRPDLITGQEFKPAHAVILAEALATYKENQDREPWMMIHPIIENNLISPKMVKEWIRMSNFLG